MSHDDLLWLANGFGLFYLIGLALIVVIYVYWPSNKKKFEQAAGSILQGKDRPWR
jgi:cytochrome c oxidase cbb3-type subunit 4